MPSIVGEMSTHQSPLADLRGAVARGDGVGVLAAIGQLELIDVAQLAGEGLLIALAQGVSEARNQTNRCITMLRQRG